MSAPAQLVPVSARNAEAASAQKLVAIICSAEAACPAWPLWSRRACAASSGLAAGSAPGAGSNVASTPPPQAAGSWAHRGSSRAPGRRVGQLVRPRGSHLRIARAHREASRGALRAGDPPGTI
eukprot:CAMPEP_0171165932 /NCGR_PEP_ID=MMETSP0790-20130122/6434_1 /TAXON_ID=2925 /ORGANISM="Alexandrium catenella, Strain OF101" /LENGTH=122 /DNA_ID=CAMNT_0011630725 /DNA_START=77 /DNA_END=443 /DNA_ORIENTATION=-